MMSAAAKWTNPKRALAHFFVDHTISADYQRAVVFESGSWEPANMQALTRMPDAAYAGRDHLRGIRDNDHDRIFLPPLRERDRLGFNALYERARKQIPTPTERSSTRR